MLSRKYRLPLRKMPNFFTESEKFFTSDLTFFYRRGETDELQVAVIVPKKSQRLAVQRHRYKRIIAELIRKRIDEWPRDLQVAIVATGKIDAKTLGKSLEKFSNFLVL
ncbi:ribonuclease P protein component [Microgenomates group bacterium]|nr:ribonuclease P protein component [Microgenomates group bacterium]